VITLMNGKWNWYLSALAALCLGVAVLTGVSQVATQVATPPRSSGSQTALLLGAAWYPEQWPEARWDADLELMERADIHFVRIGEFAWSKMEPTEGDYKLDWLERAIALAAKHHIQVVLGTPTAAPPAWLTQKYPETLRINEDGRPDEHGNRQQFNWSDPKYRELAHDIAFRMADRFGHNSNVIGWQIDNEYAEESYGPNDRQRFQEWLKSRYGTLDALNARWTTAYWSESYTAWKQIPIETGYGNPGLLLNWKLFVSDTWRSYQRNQIDAIRPHADARQFITTNMMGWFSGYDHYTVSQDLDLAAWDDYVGQGHLDPIRNGAAHDLTRGFLGKNFWVMETQPGFVNWASVNTALDKGEVRAMAWHDVGHGADAVSYWQWRSALNGQEEYHGTLVGADGTPTPLYAEVAQLGREFAKAGPALAGTSVHSEVAILHSYESRWAINWQRHNSEFDPEKELLSYYGPLREYAQSIDIVSPDAPLSQYKLVVAPALNVISQETAQKLIAYVHSGGHLVLGDRSGMKDADNGLWPQRQPGPLTDLLGGRVEQYYALEGPVEVLGDFGQTTTTAVKQYANLWAEQLSVKASDTEILLRYGKSNGWLDGQPAAITRRVGTGRITYIGASLDARTMAAAANWMIKTSGVKRALGPVPAGIDVYPRSGNGKLVYIVVNFGKETETVDLPAEMTDILHDDRVTHLTLQPYEVEVLQAASR
jgi:beta-galactosidase